MIKISYRFLYVFSCIQIIAGGHVGPDEVDECTSATLIYKLVTYNYKIISPNLNNTNIC